MTEPNKKTIADRLEQADAPCRELDWEIFCLTAPERIPYYEVDLAEAKATAEKNGLWKLRSNEIIEFQRDIYSRRYTASIEAALKIGLDDFTPQQLFLQFMEAVNRWQASGSIDPFDLPRFVCAAAMRARGE